jgi:hypothetical protein
MSGNKSFDLVGAAAGIVVAPALMTAEVASLAISAAKAYQERQRREREAAVQREQAVQQRISKICAGIKKNVIPVKVVQNLSPTVTQRDVSINTKNDVQKQVLNLASKLPDIVKEYQSLVRQQVLDSATVEQSLLAVQGAVDVSDLQKAQNLLQSLDDARQQGMTVLKESQQNIRYVEERLDAIQNRIPGAIVDSIRKEIDTFYKDGSPGDDPDLLKLHQNISEYEDQADRVQEAANHLFNSWHEVGFIVHSQEIDNGDLVMSIKTHEGVDTEMRIQFDGQQVLLNGPAEESSSCATRTHEVLQLFQEQGYYLELDSMDGEPVSEEWRRFYSVESHDSGQKDFNQAQDGRQSVEQGV